MIVFKSSGASRSFEVLAAVLLLIAISAGALTWFFEQGYLFYYGDAVAHLNIARRVIDSRTPGYGQIGTVWLPLPHLLMLPLAGHDSLWRSGLAGAIPSALCFVVTGAFLFVTTRSLFSSSAVAFAGTLLLGVNPNLLYLQSIPMTEAVFLAGLMALVWFTVAYAARPSLPSVIGAGVATVAMTLTRYDGWFLAPFAAAFFLIVRSPNRLRATVLYASLAALGPIYWLAHNRWFYGDPLEFYRGPYSAKAIYARAIADGMRPYAGDGDLVKASQYFGAAALACAGLPLVIAGVLGLLALVRKRKLWPLILFLVLPVFYVLSAHSGGTPIFVPSLWPFSYYNSRYGLMALPALVLGACALAAAAPARFRVAASIGVVVVGVAPWLWSPAPDSWICWKESEVNSESRRAWTREAAVFLREHYHGGGIITSFGDLAGVFLEAGLPLREALHSGNSPLWQASVARPDLFLQEEWALTFSGDAVATAIVRARRGGPQYECVKMIALKGAPVVEIYRREP